ncbi:MULTISPECIES: 2-oxo-hept-4-ene-1,7-dioate hydratase [Rhodococcus]|uniref:2-oxopent-4-enoate hydratase n=1 Tax=Rhodococcus jostii (strain RHA1) TaxID=101510 RepID=Q75WN7_RHOJR|nr:MULTISPECIES: 2-oxo-hepta-3-ene-1,7-dioic acid hydratase [Rhodococcus]AAR90135.1 2-oxo-4-pentenoate hydratase [Rhodococcus sp. DK17]ABH00330.1 2-oxopent-4-enoate hydratase [Rhodococcus jostii RHA1]BAA18938.1 2-hydroxypenta-2,4-dienoate hydratase [Rhodococcus sp. (in: high G+C Gram-positive bacteria)]BAC92716.1 bphE2 [Rhodococcus jostii RHA1]
MLDEQTINELAAELYRAEAERVQIEQFSQRFPGMTIDDGYQVSRAWEALKRKDGRTVLGHKIGLTSRAMQQAAGIREPDYGTLLDDMFFAEGDDVPFRRFIAPKVEVELAFVLGRSLKGPGVTIFDVLEATDFVVPAAEIIDARIQRVSEITKSRRKVEDTIADNAASAGVVVSGRPVRPDAFDLRWVGAVLSKNAMVEETGIAAGVLNHPANGIVWLVKRLARWGEGIEAGEIVLGGSFTRPVEAGPGDVFHADYGPLGSFSFRFG